MLKIYTSREIAKSLSKLEIVPDIEIRFRLRTDGHRDLFNDSTSKDIIRQIEGTSEWYEGYLSTGCKGLLLATKFNNEFIINIDELGYNCIKLLFEISKQMDIEVISTRILYHMEDEYVASINGNTKKGVDISFLWRKS